MHIDRADDVSVDLSHEHHPGDIKCVRVGHSQSIAKLRNHTEPLHESADLWSATMNHHGKDSHRTEQHYVLSEARESLSLIAITERVPTVFDDNGPPRKAANERYGLSKDIRSR